MSVLIRFPGSLFSHSVRPGLTGRESELTANAALHIRRNPPGPACPPVDSHHSIQRNHLPRGFYMAYHASAFAEWFASARCLAPEWTRHLLCALYSGLHKSSAAFPSFTSNQAVH